MQTILDKISSMLWGVPLLVLIMGTGALLMWRLRGMPLLRIGYAFRELNRGRQAQGGGDISPFGALMTSLSATIGTGNISGVATAIALGGPGALFWMWCSALLGMATKYAEGVLAVRYREVDGLGHHVGGPMYYIRNGLGPKWAWLGLLFAFFGAFAGFGIGNSVQANSVAKALEASFKVDPVVSAVVMMLLVGMVLLGGVKAISKVSSSLVPFMSVAYILAALVILAVHIADIPEALVLIVSSAFTPLSVAGGAVGFAVSQAMQYGVARGVFSNEAGLGSAPIAHAAAATNSPVRQGSVAMLGTFIDTIIICSMTGLCIVVTGVWDSGLSGVELSQSAFDESLPFGGYVISFSLSLFAFTTILGWSYYSERCAQYLFGTRIIFPFRVCWVVVVGLGATSSMALVWTVADILNGLMAIPNLIALLLLSGVVVKLTRDYFAEQQ